MASGTITTSRPWGGSNYSINVSKTSGDGSIKTPTTSYDEGSGCYVFSLVNPITSMVTVSPDSNIDRYIDYMIVSNKQRIVVFSIHFTLTYTYSSNSTKYTFDYGYLKNGKWVTGAQTSGIVSGYETPVASKLPLLNLQWSTDSAFIKENGTWKPIVIFEKNNGEWI